MRSSKGPSFLNFSKLSLSKTRNLINSLEKDYCCNLDELRDFHFYIGSKDKVMISSVLIDEVDVDRINFVGIYFGTFHDDSRFRLSLEGSKFVKATKNFVKLNSFDILSGFLAGQNLFLEEVEFINCDGTCPFLIVEFDGEHLGCVSRKEEELLTYLPKSRKLDFGRVF